MKYQTVCLIFLLAIYGCATDSTADHSKNYEKLDTVTVVDAADPVAGSYHPSGRDKIDHGAYLTVLLGCGSCHTNGAFDGSPDLKRALAGSNTGIAFTNPLGDKYPGIIYPANITPDIDTGIGQWTDRQIADAIRAGIGRYRSHRIVTMPWPGYARLGDDDVDAIVAYLRSIEPISNRVPEEVQPGQQATAPFVYFGVYRSKQ